MARFVIVSALIPLVISCSGNNPFAPQTKFAGTIELSSIGAGDYTTSQIGAAPDGSVYFSPFGEKIYRIGSDHRVAGIFRSETGDSLFKGRFLIDDAGMLHTFTTKGHFVYSAGGKMLGQDSLNIFGTTQENPSICFSGDRKSVFVVPVNNTANIWIRKIDLATGRTVASVDKAYIDGEFPRTGKKFSGLCSEGGHLFVSVNLDHSTNKGCAVAVFSEQLEFTVAVYDDWLFNGARGVATDEHGNLYVVNQFSGLVKIFRIKDLLSGRFRVIGYSYPEGWVEDDNNAGNGFGSLKDPSVVAVAGKYYYVVCPFDRRMKVFETLE